MSKIIFRDSPCCYRCRFHNSHWRVCALFIDEHGNNISNYSTAICDFFTPLDDNDDGAVSSTVKVNRQALSKLPPDLLVKVREFDVGEPKPRSTLKHRRELDKVVR